MLLALPQHEMLYILAAFMFIGFLLIEVNAWTVIFGAFSSVAYLAITKGSSRETLFMLCILAILVIKHFEELHTMPGARGRLVRWLQIIIRGTQFTI